MRGFTPAPKMDRPVNLSRATSTCNAFYIFLSAAKAALLPFLTLFFYIIGLSAMETGIIMAAKTLTGFFWAPLWARCATAYSKRRVVLVFSLLMMGAMYMSFIAVYYKVGNPQTCLPAVSHGHGENATSSFLNKTNTTLVSIPSNQPGPTTVKNNITSQITELPTEVVHTPASPVTGIKSNKEVINTGHAISTSEPHKPATPSNPHTTETVHSHEEEQPQGTESTVRSSKPESPVQDQPAPSDSDRETIQHLLVDNAPYLKEIQKAGVSASELHDIVNDYFPDQNISDTEIKKILEAANSMPSDTPENRKVRVRRTLHLTFWNDFTEKVNMVTSTLKEDKLLLFVIVLLVIIFGEFFSSPVEKIADDAWFDFLERIDDMEKYGRQRYWGSLTFALVPIIVTVLVDYTPCHLMNLHHFLLHFFVFGVFMIFAVILAFYFPMPPPSKQKYVSKVGKGLRVICCDGRGFLFVVTLLVAGSVFAAFNNFLFWHLLEMGSREVTMGLCVSIGAFAETPMLVFSNKLVRKLGNGGLTSLSLFILALRVLYYGFLWTPWAVLPAEISNAFTHTALWYAVLSYDEFNMGSAMDRSIRSILSSMYFGLGFSVGSFVSGVVYYLYGASVLFWGASVVSGTWCIVFSLIQCCLPQKERVKYIKLLRKEDDESSEGEDDWLEMALKDQ